MEAFRAVVSGRVQMVMYRDFAARAARSLGVVGTVKNLEDGTVEVVAEGDRSTLEAYIEKLKRGSLLSHVKDAQVSWQNPTGAFTDFQMLF